MDRMQAEQIAAAQLDPGERLLWSGFPSPGAAARRALPAAAFGIPFTAFAVFWIATAYSFTSKGPHVPGPWALFPLFGIPFLLVGLGVLTAPIWVYLGAEKTVYAVTEKRAMIIVNVAGRGVQSFTHEDMSNITRTENANGSGSIYFASRMMSTSQSGMMRMTRIGFEGIPDVRQVEQLIRDQMGQKAA
ncbi:MAG TPA: hypothetical protein VMJ70_15530 [Candidatus Sulfotelmatobacter sp.]|nr:hypothetical protein [Candidatus Sulfotelmatobacter sp.]